MLLVLLASAHPVDEETVAEIRRQGQWEAMDVAVNPLAEYSEEEVVGLLGTTIGQSMTFVTTPNVADHFDARETFGACSHPIRNQAHCGSCWAFGAAEVLSDNLCALTASSSDHVLSPQDLVSCDGNDSGCQGGMLPFAWMFIQKQGLVTDACLPYVSQDGNVPSCSSSCSDGSSWKTYTCPTGTKPQVFESAEEIQKAVMKGAAVETAYNVYADFMNYQSGVYRHVTGELKGGHAVRIVGWGTDDTGLYWTVANSWGPSWGMEGYFNIYDWSIDGDSKFAQQGGYGCGTGGAALPAEELVV